MSDDQKLRHVSAPSDSEFQTELMGTRIKMRNDGYVLEDVEHSLALAGEHNSIYSAVLTFREKEVPE